MPRGNRTSTAGGMLSDLKSRLGFSGDGGRDDGFGDFGEYDDFDDDGYSPSNDREYAGYGADYDENAPVSGYRPLSTQSSGKYGRSSSTPDLVSIDDVKASTRSSSAAGTTRQANGRDLVGSSGPAQSSPAYNARVRERDARPRSEGLDSLFEPTGSASSARAGAAALRDSRGLSVVKPLSYSDAEQVTRALKAGDIVVLDMASTSEDLSKRILDFAFGAASALDASVESPAAKVFAIARGRALSDEEKSRLRTQGVL